MCVGGKSIHSNYAPQCEGMMPWTEQYPLPDPYHRFAGSPLRRRTRVFIVKATEESNNDRYPMKKKRGGGGGGGGTFPFGGAQPLLSTVCLCEERGRQHGGRW